MNVTDKAAGTRDWSVRMRGCKRRRKDRKQRNKQTKKAEGPNSHCHHWHGREGVMWLVAETMSSNTGRKGRCPLRLPRSPTQTPAPAPADDPKCPPSAPTVRITSNVQIVRIGKTDPAFLRCGFGIPTHLCKRTDKEIDGLCFCELTGYVRVTVGVIMLLFTFWVWCRLRKQKIYEKDFTSVKQYEKKKDDLKKKKTPEQNYWRFFFFILSLFSYISVCLFFLTLQLLCVKEKQNSCCHFLTMCAV